MPVYKAMFEHMPTSDMLIFKRSAAEGCCHLQMLKHYTSVCFGRLLALAGKNLRLSETHFAVALEATVNDSGLILAPNLQQEQVSFLRTDARHCCDLKVLCIFRS